MFVPSNPQALVSEVGKISRSDRWIVHHRLQELSISCWCPADGTLWIDAILLGSIVQQLVASRQELIDWLERCWKTQLPRSSH